MEKLKGDRILGTVSLLIGLVFLIGSFRIRHIASISDALGARFWPQFLSAMVVILSIVLIAQSHIKLKALTSTEKEADGFTYFEDKKKAGLVLAAVILYAAAIPLMGFPITTAVVSAILMVILGMKVGLKLFVSAIGLTAALVLIFPILLGIPLPRGIGIFETITRLIY